MVLGQELGDLFKRYDRAGREHRAEGFADALFRVGVLRLLGARSLVPDQAQRRAILETRDVDKLERWLATATVVRSVAELLESR